MQYSQGRSWTYHNYRITPQNDKFPVVTGAFMTPARTPRFTACSPAAK